MVVRADETPVLSCQRRVLDSIKRTRHVETVRLSPLVPETEAASIINPERDKPGVAGVLAEPHARPLLQPLRRIHDEPLRRRAPPTRFKRKRKDVRVVEVFLLFCHSDAVEPAKHISVRRDANKCDVRPPLDLLKQAPRRELVNGARRFSSPSPSPSTP